ncbi:DUF6542 domain-containing protein [Nocardia huaxiensis]|uniref:DUF6542 domain-containing protein n=1 Tax=Nocardia huaxiensis TaxID=2755382 RepID=A0A7D6VDT5_9NOCA|nr:DUF6542 domain-containing protein [Nocardia huaxiensis]QLY32733.1 hypothetical protein H0264_11175 [Nocardia huaxiensis]UFS93533.1 hypothetical protein LPY97_22200 [Nocardia huaxiensis]
MAVTQNERAEVPSSHRSILPTVPGVPAGAAVLVAVTCTFIGFFIDSRGGTELTGTFATLYVVGCLLAALIVRYRGLFTAMVLPPLLLFVAVPVAYQLMLGSSGNPKELLLNLAIPLVNRFPTMALATVLVLAVGAVRVFLHRREEESGSGGQRTPRSRPARSAAARGQRTRPADSKDPARRRFRGTSEEATADTDAEATARPSRRPAGRTAERPPRVNANRPAAETARGRAAADRGRAEDQSAPERTRTGRPAARGNRQPDRARAAKTADRQAAAQPAERKPAAPGERKPAPGRRAAPERNGQPNVQQGEPRRRRNPNGEVPPHPRPNVRYRERDSGRIER